MSLYDFLWDILLGLASDEMGLQILRCSHVLDLCGLGAYDNRCCEKEEV